MKLPGAVGWGQGIVNVATLNSGPWCHVTGAMCAITVDILSTVWSVDIASTAPALHWPALHHTNEGLTIYFIKTN
jgi:hypothetical protein